MFLGRMTQQWLAAYTYFYVWFLGDLLWHIYLWFLLPLLQ